MKKWYQGGWIAGVICCVLGICMLGGAGGGFWEEQKLRFVQGVQESAERMYLPGIAYRGEAQKGRESSPARWLMERALELAPLGSYLAQRQEELSVEDRDTYELLVRRQAADENAVDENGGLIGEDNSAATTQTQALLDLSPERLADFDYLVGNFYTVDSVTYVTPEDLNAAELLEKDLRIDPSGEGPKILIFHTHSQEAFADSDGTADTSIVGVGRHLAELLSEKYGLETLHHEGVYDLIGGKLDRSEAYELAKPEIEQILQEHPSIQVVIDLHRDGVGESTHLAAEVNGKPTAQIMFFNGMCRTRSNGDLQGMQNPYLQDNLAFSLQMKLAAEKSYPGFTRRNYLKGYKYNMDLAPRMLLIEAGAQTNTLEEMQNAMEPLADLLHQVLVGEEEE